MNAASLVIGIGNRHRGDDAFGPLIADALTARGINAIEHSGEPAGLMECWQGCQHVILVDAVFSGAAPGTLHAIDLIARKLPAAFAKPSSHAVGIAEAVEFARVLNKMPETMHFFGIEGAHYTHGAPLSTAVAQARTHIIEKIEDKTRLYSSADSSSKAPSE